MNWRTVLATVLGLGLLATPVMAQEQGWMLVEPSNPAGTSFAATRFKTHAACNAWMQKQMKAVEKLHAVTCDEILEKGYTAQECARWNKGQRNLGEMMRQGMHCISRKQFKSSYTEADRQRMGVRMWVFAYPK